MSDRDVQAAIDAIHGRMERGRHPILQAIDQSKRGVLLAIREEQTTPSVVMAETHRSLATQDLSFGEYIQVQGARNAAAWVMGDLDSI